MDSKITALTELTTPASGDVLAIVDDPSGTPATKKVEVDSLDDYLSASTKTLTNKTLTSPVLNTGVSGTAVLDEDDMSSNSATKLATQQSIKAYVNSNASVASSATPSPTGDKFRNSLYITALAEDAEFAAPSGTPANGNMLLIRVKDDGTARALTYNAIYDGLYDTLPATTTISKYLYMLFIYNSTSEKWEMVSYVEEE